MTDPIVENFVELYCELIDQSPHLAVHNLDSVTQSRVLVVLEKLREQPFLHCKKLKQAEVGVLKQRIGDYRLRYDVIGHDMYLYRVRHRKEVYRP